MKYVEQLECPKCKAPGVKGYRHFRCYTKKCKVVHFDYVDYQEGFTIGILLINEKRITVDVVGT